MYLHALDIIVAHRGSPIAVVVRNKDQRSGDYSEMSVAYRPSHADATYDFKYGIRAVAGGGRSSAREAIGRCAAGAIAKKLLKTVSGTEVSRCSMYMYKGLGLAMLVGEPPMTVCDRAHDVDLPQQILAYVNAVRDVRSNVDNSKFTLEEVESNIVRCPDQEAAKKMIDGVF